jgi:hypothetical protein
MSMLDMVFCQRRQRTLGVIAIVIGLGAWAIGFQGAVVAVNQNFMGWIKISKGEFAFGEQLYIDPFLLSAAVS